MLTWLKELLWDKAQARIAILGLAAGLAMLFAQPKGREWWESAPIALLAALGGGGAAASMGKKE